MEKLIPGDAGPDHAEEPRAGSTAAPTAMTRRTWIHTGWKDQDMSNSKNCQGNTRGWFKEGT